jgi:hypothetical protein
VRGGLADVAPQGLLGDGRRRLPSFPFPDPLLTTIQLALGLVARLVVGERLAEALHGALDVAVLIVHAGEADELDRRFSRPAA